MLSLALATLVVMLIGMAIDAHVTISQRGRGKVEQAQLARSVFRLIGDDLRSTILYAPLDFSSIANLNLDADVGGGSPDAGGGTGGDVGGGGMGGGMGGDDPSGAPDGAPGGAGGVPGGSSGGATGGGGGASQGGGSTGGTSGGGTAGGTAGGGSSADTGSLLDSATASEADPPGVYGSAYGIELDISRVPRVDEYEQMVQNGRGAIADVPSDVKTVAYYCTGGANATASPGGPLSSDAEGGLVRRSVDRAVTQYALSNGSTASLDDSGAVLAPEVKEISFLYFDGSAWIDYWDMVEMGSPPLAVQITVAISAPRVESMFERTWNAISGADAQSDEVTTYTQVVYLPTAEGASGSAAMSGATDSTAESDSTGTEAAP